MAIFKSPKAAPAATAADAIEPQLQIVDAAMKEKDTVAETAENGQTVDVKDVEQKKKADAGLGNYYRVFSYGTKFDALLIILSIISAIGAGIAMPLMNIVFGQLVGDFTNYFIPGTTVTKQQFQAGVNKNSLYIVYLFIGKFVLSYVSMLTIRISGLRISAALRLAYLRATFAQPVSMVDKVSPGIVSSRITTSSNTIQLAISQHIALLFQSLSFTIALYVVAFVKAWLLTLVASASLPFILIVYGPLVPPFIKIHTITEKIHEQASSFAFEIFTSIRVIVAFGAESKLATIHGDLLEKAAKNEKRNAPLMGLMMAPMMAAMYGTFGIAFWFGIQQFSKGIGNVGDITVVLFSVMLAVMNIGRVASPIIAIAKASAVAKELFTTIDAKVPDTSGLKDPEVSSDAEITFENVAFSYPSRPNVQILDGLNLTFEAGKVTAIVGPSGSGKSTVVGLVQRWYDLLGTTAKPKPIDDTSSEKTEKDAEKELTATETKKDSKKKAKKDKEEADKKAAEEVVDEDNTCTGSVKIGNVDLRNVDLKWWRSQIGLVQQEPFLFNDTLFNNVAYGLCGTKWENISKEEKMRMVEDACKEACAIEFISRLPQGYETMVGESGIKLSGGQRQRIAIARSIIKQCPILILDEATSAIDVRTERIVQEALDRVSKNRTTIVIAHRLSTIKRADKIIVLRQGKLVEQGSHEELLKDELGVYSGLVHAQNLAMEAVQEDDDDMMLKKTKTSATDRSKADHTREERASTTSDDPEYKQQGLVKSFGRMLFEQRHQWLLFTLMCLGILVAGAVYPLQAYIFAKVIEVFTFPKDQLVSKGNFWAGMFGVEAAAVGVAYFVCNTCAYLVGVITTRTYRQEYLVNILRKRIAFFDAEGHSPGSLTSKLSADTTSIQQLLGTEMCMALIACVNLVGSTIIAFVYGWKLSLVALFCALPPILAAGILRFRLEVQFEKMNAAVFEDSSQFAAEAVGAFRTVISLTMEDMIGDRYQGLLKGHVTNAFRSAKYGTIVFAASDSVELACMALAFWYGGTLLASREYTVVDFFVIYTAVIQGAVAAGMWFGFAPNMAEATGAANRILSLRTPKDFKPPVYKAIEPTSGGVSIDFQNVYFTYKSRDVPVLSNLNIKVEPGQFAALVGASGCGKSTTISLLERFYDADSGSILYNGQDITSLDPAEYRKQISLVSQEPTLYEGTIKDNICLSVDSATDAEIQKACEDAQIHTFISSLPDGYSTRLGTKGMSLSGGQKQRLSLARALLRSPKLLLLDEATSSLDSESEKQVQAAIERQAGEGSRTIIAVAHRLATIQKADVIYVIGSGRVLEEGDHQGLLRKRGIYWQMCQAQALDR